MEMLHDNWAAQMEMMGYDPGGNPLKKKAQKVERPEILPKPLPIYDENHGGKFPEMIRVSFSDGSTAVYELKVEQPAPVIIENIKIIRKWKQGYVNQPERRRRRR